MKGKTLESRTCGWIKTQPVVGEKCTAAAEEKEFVNLTNLVDVFAHRCNLLLDMSV